MYLAAAFLVKLVTAECFGMDYYEQQCPHCIIDFLTRSLSKPVFCQQKNGLPSFFLFFFIQFPGPLGV